MRTKRFRRVALVALALAAVVATVVYVVPAARTRAANVAQGREWAGLLKKHPAFSAKPPAYPVEVAFHYAASTDEDLRKIRDTYHLDEVAGEGPEIDRIINLMAWTYRLTTHANEPKIPEVRNALTLIPLARDQHMAINCYLKTVILNEVYLAMGFESRQTHLLPAENEEDESHYVTSVFSRTLGRWIVMDADFGAYVTDGTGAILGVAEIRKRLISGEPMVGRSVEPPAGFFARVWSDVRDFVDGASYLWYLKKNFFKIECPEKSLFNLAAIPNRQYYQLIPDGYREELLLAPKINERGHKIVYINDEGLFWQRPDGAGRSSGPAGLEKGVVSPRAISLE